MMGKLCYFSASVDNWAENAAMPITATFGQSIE